MRKVRTSWRARSACLTLAAVLAVAVAATGDASAQGGPSGPIEITVGTSPGGTPDVLMRQAAKILNEEKIVEQPIVVQNRTGGSWTVAANWVVGRTGDENTLLGIAQPIITTPITQGLPTVYDKVTPISMFVQGDLVICVQPDSEADSLKDLVEMAGSGGKAIRVAGAQAGSTDHMVASLVEKAGNIKLNYVPFDGGGAATAAFLGGNVDMITLSPVEAMPLAESKKLKIIAILDEERRTEPELADIPTAKEQGYDVVWGQAWGLAGPPDLAPELVTYWDGVIAKLVKTDAWKASLKENFFRSKVTPASEAEAEFKKMHEQHLALLRDLGLAKQQ